MRLPMSLSCQEESLEGTRLLPLRKCLCAHLQYLTHPIAYVALSFFQFISSVAVLEVHKDFICHNNLNICNGSLFKLEHAWFVEVVFFSLFKICPHSLRNRMPHILTFHKPKLVPSNHWFKITCTVGYFRPKINFEIKQIKAIRKIAIM